jgi:antitoxin Phd
MDSATLSLKSVYAVLVLSLSHQIHQHYFTLNNRLYLSYFLSIIKVKLLEVLMMLVDMKNLVSITEANRNFSKIARAVDENGSVVILKNNAPKYVIISYDQIAADEQVSDEQLLAVSRKSFKRHEAAYKELAK